MKALNKGIVICFGLLCLLSQTATAADDPTQFLKAIADKMVVKVESQKDSLKQDESLARKLVREELLPVIDQQGFAKRTLGKKIWLSASANQKQQFVNEFTNLVISTYAKGLSLYDGQKFSFEKAKFSKSGKTAIVRSAMLQADGSSVAIDYRLKKTNDQWHIIDLTIEGVSMVKSYKNQFVPKVNQLGMEGFLKQLAEDKQKS